MIIIITMIGSNSYDDKLVKGREKVTLFMSFYNAFY